MKKLFLLGGHDLEMVAIRELLLCTNHTFLDKNLQWHNAFVDNYLDEIQAFINKEDVTIYAIELQYRNIFPIGNLIIIDHHNEMSYMPSALEQVANLLGVQLNREMKLIAANDKGYIPAMKGFGANREEILEIRKADRKAQGVTDEDERLSELAVNNKKIYCSLIVVNCIADKFSPVCDRLYPYKKLVIYNDVELMYYGEGAEKVFELAIAYFGQENLFRGGGKNGFVGVKRHKAEREEIIEFVKHLIKEENEY